MGENYPGGRSEFESRLKLVTENTFNKNIFPSEYIEPLKTIRLENNCKNLEDKSKTPEDEISK